MAAAGAAANGAEAEQAGQEQVPGPHLEAAVLKDAIRTLLAAEESLRTVVRNSDRMLPERMHLHSKP